MEYKFTKNVEEDFDKIADGSATYVEMLQEFRDETLKKDLENAGANAEKVVEKV
jgi:DNA topoisomerase IA